MVFTKINKGEISLGIWNDQTNEFDLTTEAVLFVNREDKIYGVKKLKFISSSDSAVKLVTDLDDSDYAEIVPE